MTTNLSLEERVNLAYRKLTLIIAATDEGADEHPNVDELFDSIQQEAREAAEAIEPLRHAPAKVGNWEPPAAEDGA